MVFIAGDCTWNIDGTCSCVGFEQNGKACVEVEQDYVICASRDESAE